MTVLNASGPFGPPATPRATLWLPSSPCRWPLAGVAGRKNEAIWVSKPLVPFLPWLLAEPYPGSVRDIPCRAAKTRADELQVLRNGRDVAGTGTDVAISRDTGQHRYPSRPGRGARNAERDRLTLGDGNPRLVKQVDIRWKWMGRTSSMRPDQPCRDVSHRVRREHAATRMQWA